MPSAGDSSYSANQPQELFDAFAVGAGVGEIRHDVVGAGDDPQVGVRLGGVEFVGHGGGVAGVGSAVDEQDGNSGAGDGAERAGLGDAVPGEHPAHLAGQGQDEAGRCRARRWQANSA